MNSIMPRYMTQALDNYCQYMNSIMPRYMTQALDNYCQYMNSIMPRYMTQALDNYYQYEFHNANGKKCVSIVNMIIDCYQLTPFSYQ